MSILGIEELVYSQKLNRNHFVIFLRQLLPRGPIWHIPLLEEIDILANSVSSSEDFGRVTITSGNTVITPNGVVSAEEFGASTVSAP